MAQHTLKKLKYDGSEVVVEVANRDGSGNVITSTYATKSELTTGLGGKQDTLTEGDGIDISSGTISVEKTSSSNLGGMITGTGLEAANDGTVSLKIAGANQLGGVKIGNNISIDSSTGAISCTSLTWSNVSSKPFNEVDSGSGKHFTITSNKLYVNTDVFPTKTFVSDNYISTTTYSTLVNTTLPATYQAKHANLTSISGLSTSSTGLIKLTNGVASLDTNTYLTSHQSLSNYYTKSEITSLFNGIKEFSYEVVSELPTASADTMYKIYIVPATNSATNNVKDEFITIRSGSEGSYTYSWEQIGSTTMNLSNYITSDNELAASSLVITDGSGRKIKSWGSVEINGNWTASITTIPTTQAVSSFVTYNCIKHKYINSTTTTLNDCISTNMTGTGPQVKVYTYANGTNDLRTFIGVIHVAIGTTAQATFELEEIGPRTSGSGTADLTKARRRYVGQCAASTTFSSVIGGSTYLENYITTAQLTTTDVTLDY